MEGFKGVLVEEHGGHEREKAKVGGSAAKVGFGGSKDRRSGMRKVVEDYPVMRPAFEEVFMNVARKAGAVGGVQVVVDVKSVMGESTVRFLDTSDTSYLAKY